MENQRVARARCASNDENAYPSSPPLGASKRENGYDITTASTARALLNVTNLLPKRHTLSNGATTTSTASPRHYRSATASSPGDNITWSVLPKTTLLSSESDIQSVTNAEASSPIAESTARPAGPLPCYTSAGDPATELLKRYHAHLDDSMYSEAAGTPSSKVGVRRSISCEPEWPRSALRKRRKQKAVEGQQQEEVVVPVDVARAADPASAASAALANTASDAEVHKEEVKEEEEEDYFGSEDDFDLADLDQMEARLDAKSNGDKQQSMSTMPAKPDVASAASFGEFEDAFSDDINTSQLKKDPPPVKAESTKGFGDSFDDIDDEMDDDNLDPYEVDRLLTQFEQAVPEKKVQKLTSADYALLQRSSQKGYHRLKVEEISDGRYLSNQQRVKPELRITATDEKDPGSTLRLLVLLRDDWVETILEKGDVVNVIGEFDASGQCVIDKSEGLLISNPDYLIPITTVSQSYECSRRAVLGQRVKSATESNVATAYGTIVHELFQTCMLERDFSTEFMDQRLKGIISRNIEMLFFVMEPLDRVWKHVRERYPLIQNWASKHVAALQKNPGKKSNNDISIVEILETEERIWSPMYGLKGSLDMTIRAAGGAQGGVRTMPFEIKTGRKTAIANHRAQTILYTLMLSDRYDMPVIQGILYYLDFSEAISVPATQLEIGALIRGRNFVAHSGQKATVSAPLVSNTGRCNSCFSVKPCFLYYKAANGPSEPLEKTEYEKMTENVGEEEKKFLLHWDELLTMEEKSMGKFLNEMWLMSGVERQRVGRCFASLRVESKSSAVLDGSSRIEYTLCRAADVEAAVDDGSGSFLDSQINVGDQILVSDSLGHLALASGILKAVGPDWIAISVDREFDTRSRYGAAKTATDKITYRVEKDEFSNIMAMIRNNIIQLLMDPGCVAKKRLIVNLDAPRFVEQRPGSQATMLQVSRGLNVDQKWAVEHVLAAEDYALIMGMPGTGKTTTIVRVIEAILAQKKSILLASYTHTAVDNILLKIKSSASSILRLGPTGKIHPEVKKFVVTQSNLPDNFADLQKYYFDSQIVATTCLGIGNPLFTKRRFDYCIIDEASQVTLPVCVGPLRYADRFILVGDDYQLSPLVRDKRAKAGGLDASLFKTLSEAHPASVVTLEHQYRMCEEVMTLSNLLVYDGKLKCGSEEVARQKLAVPKGESALREIHAGGGECGERCWIKDLLDEGVKVVFVDTDEIPGTEVMVGDRVQNKVEATMVQQITKSLLLGGVAETDIGIISIYRAQLKLIRQGLEGYKRLEMQTVDKFQGRDKECVIISLVRSNSEDKVGELLTEWRRLNVTFTRARSKLVIFGSRSTLKKVAMLERFFALVEGKGWMYSAPAGAQFAHPGLSSSSAEETEEEQGVCRVDKTRALSSRPVLCDIVNAMK